MTRCEEVLVKLVWAVADVEITTPVTSVLVQIARVGATFESQIHRRNRACKTSRTSLHPVEVGVVGVEQCTRQVPSYVQRFVGLFFFFCSSSSLTKTCLFLCGLG